jgi:hypothetical protein
MEFAELKESEVARLVDGYGREIFGGLEED